ncbi:MAG: MbcA/ParS/Xre antitoxin family protein [Acidobacteriota bacterium]|nr:MbcA/ParS/Xre antitoxin family protein [Acidobacteriota bacterium]
MGATRSPAVTGLPEQSFQLEHPSSEAIWKRAVEVFGTEDLARKWLGTPLPILGQSTPQQFSSSGEVAKQREILTILGRIDYGIFS